MHGYTPLHRLIGTVNKKDIVSHEVMLSLLTKLVVEIGVDLNVRDKAGRTALHHLAKKATKASVIRNLPVWKALNILLQHGADPTIRDKRGNLPLDYCNTNAMPVDTTTLFLFVQSMMLPCW